MKHEDMKDLYSKYEEKIQDIKKRKRALRHVQDSKLVKKMKKDLTREKRSAKRSEKQELKNSLREYESK